MGAETQVIRAGRLMRIGVIAIFLVLPAAILLLATGESSVLYLFAPPIIGTAVAYIFGVRTQRASWIVGIALASASGLTWLFYLASSPDQELALMGPLGVYVICVLIAVIGSIADAYGISRAKKARAKQQLI